MRRHALRNLSTTALALVAAGAVFVAACFERNFTVTCPGNTTDVNGQCYTQLPDGFQPPADMTMVKCTDGHECPVDMPVCGPQQTCIACTPQGANTACNSFHQQTPLCGAAGGCVECNTKDDCASVNKTCVLSSNKCGACTANTDCTSGLCDTPSGTCTPSSMLLYVNNAPTAGCSDSGAGSLNRPFCTVQAGFTAAAGSGKTLIVFSSTYPESVVAQPGAAAYVVRAIGVGVTPPAIVPPASPSAAALSLQNSGTQQLTLTLDNFIMRGAAGASGNGIFCSGNNSNRSLTKLTLLRSTVQSNAQLGVNASNCDVTLDQVTLASNAQGGATLVNPDFTVENAIIRDNGTAGAGSGSSVGGFYWMGTTSRAQIINVTVVNNKNDSTGINPSGIACGTPNMTVMFNAVLKGNSGVASETGGCAPTYSAYNGATSGAGNRDVTLCSAAQLFVDPTNNDYHPQKMSSGACTVVLVDAGTPMSGGVNAPDHDIVGTHRPQGAGFDIGAYEAL